MRAGARGSEITARLEAALVVVGVPFAQGIGAASTRSGVLSARTFGAARRSDFVVPHARVIGEAVGSSDLGWAARSETAPWRATTPNAERITFANCLGSNLSLITAAKFTAARFTDASVATGVPLAAPGGDAEGFGGVSCTFFGVHIVCPNAVGSDGGVAVERGRTDRAAIFTTDWAACGVEHIPPAIEDGIGDASSFRGVERATFLEALVGETQALVLVDVATRIVGAISHDGVGAFIFGADSRAVPLEPFASGRVFAGSLIVVDGAIVVTAGGLVGAPFAERIEDAFASQGAPASSAGLVIASGDGGVPRAEFGGRSSSARSGVAVLHALSGTADTLDDRIVDGGIAVQGSVDDLTVLAGVTGLEDFEVEVQAVKVGAAVGVGAREVVVGVPVAIDLLVADDGQIVLRAAPRFLEGLSITQNAPRHADGFQNLASEVIEVDGSEGVNGGSRDDAHESHLIVVVTKREERVDGLANVSALDDDTAGRDGAGSSFSGELIAFLTSGDEKDHLLARRISVSCQDILGLVEGRRHLISDQRLVVDGAEVGEIVFEFAPRSGETTQSATSSVLVDGTLDVTVLNETNSKTLIRSETTGRSGVGSGNRREASSTDPLLHVVQETEPTVRVTTNRVGELVEVAHHDDHVDGVAVGGTGVLADLERATPRAFGVLGAIARASVVGAFSFQAEAESVVPGAILRVPAAGSGVLGDLVALVDGAARRRDGEIPCAAVV